MEVGTRGAHVKHVPHVCDVGRVEAQRLIERRRALRSKRRAQHRRRGDMRARRREGGAGWSVVAQAATRPATVEVEGRARAERT